MSTGGRWRSSWRRRGALFAPDALLERLTERLPLLTGGPRDQPARLRTMRTSLSWSYDLLPPEEQRVFRCLAVFVGGCTLAAAESVCGVPAEGGRRRETKDERSSAAHRPLPASFVDIVESLIHQSLISMVTPPDSSAGAGEPRLTMLETVREFAAEELAASGEQPSVQRAHAAFDLDLAEAHDLAEVRPDSERVLARLEFEPANFSAALEWQEATGDAEGMVRMAAALGSFWATQGHYQEGQHYLERALACGDVGESCCPDESHFLTVCNAPAVCNLRNTTCE